MVPILRSDLSAEGALRAFPLCNAREAFLPHVHGKALCFAVESRRMQGEGRSRVASAGYHSSGESRSQSPVRGKSWSDQLDCPLYTGASARPVAEEVIARFRFQNRSFVGSHTDPDTPPSNERRPCN